jgi:YtkA-like protein
MKRTLILAAALAAGCSSQAEGSASFPDAPLVRLESDSGALTIELRTSPEQPPSRGTVSVEYRVANTGGQPVDGLTLDVVPWMPDMGHGTSTKPTVTDEGGGHYVVSDVSLYMPGRWQLRTTFSGSVHDGVVPLFQIP